MLEILGIVSNVGSSSFFQLVSHDCMSDVFKMKQNILE